MALCHSDVGLRGPSDAAVRESSSSSLPPKSVSAGALCFRLNAAGRRGECRTAVSRRSASNQHSKLSPIGEPLRCQISYASRSICSRLGTSDFSVSCRLIFMEKIHVAATTADSFWRAAIHPGCTVLHFRPTGLDKYQVRIGITGSATMRPFVHTELQLCYLILHALTRRFHASVRRRAPSQAATPAIAIQPDSIVVSQRPACITHQAVSRPVAKPVKAARSTTNRMVIR